MEKELSFEEKINNLEKIVKELENGDVALDDAINKFNEAIKLANSCNKTLEEATKTVNSSNEANSLKSKLTNLGFEVKIKEGN